MCAIGVAAFGFIISKLAKSGADTDEDNYAWEGAFDDAASYAYLKAYPNGSSPYEVVSVDFYFNGVKCTRYYQGCSRPINRPIKIE
jgi:hypothetical protein